MGLQDVSASLSALLLRTHYSYPRQRSFILDVTYPIWDVDPWGVSFGMSSEHMTCGMRSNAKGCVSIIV